MQITNNIQINCAVCGAAMPTDISVGFEPDRHLHIFRVMPCTRCEKPLNQQVQHEQAFECGNSEHCGEAGDISCNYRCGNYSPVG